MLREAVKIYGTNHRGCWTSIAEHTGYGLSGQQCWTRWHHNLDPALSRCKQGPWSEEEVRGIIIFYNDSCHVVCTFFRCCADAIIILYGKRCWHFLHVFKYSWLS